MALRLNHMTPFFLAAAAALAGCLSEEDIARKQALIDAIAVNSLTKCDLQVDFPQDTDYRTRLTQALDTSSIALLETIGNNRVTICLDRRLEILTVKNWRGKNVPLGLQAGFYRRTVDDGPVITLWDDGRDPANAGWLEKNITTYSNTTLKTALNDKRLMSKNPDDSPYVAFGGEKKVSYGCKKEVVEKRWLGLRRETKTVKATCEKTAFVWEGWQAHRKAAATHPGLMMPPLKAK